MVFWIEPSEIAEFVGAQSFERGSSYARDGHVEDFEWQESNTLLVGSVTGSRYTSYDVQVYFGVDDSGGLEYVESDCSCPMMEACKHVAALILVAQDKPSDPSMTAAMPGDSAWRSALGPLARGAISSAASNSPMGLQFSLVQSPRYPGNRGATATQQRRLGVRPVIIGKQGKWIRGSMNWHSLGYTRGVYDPKQVRMLTSLLALNSVGRYNFQGDSQWIYLDSFPVAVLWEVLAEGARAGVEFVYESRTQQPVNVSQTPMELELDVSKSADGLLIAPALTHEGVRIPAGTFGFIGDPAHGIFTWGSASVTKQEEVSLTLAPLGHAISNEIRQLALTDRNSVIVPAEEESSFVRDFLPLLARSAVMVSLDETFAFPEPPQPILLLTIFQRPGVIAEVTWQWDYGSAGAELMGLWPDSRDPRYRDLDQEATILGTMGDLIHHYKGLRAYTAKGIYLAPTSTLSGSECIDFLALAVPVLSGMEGIDVRMQGDAVAYRQAAGPPVISLAAVERPGSRDWFDLSVSVTIEDEEVPFDELFMALATDQHILVLPSGVYFSLDRPELQQLRNLIEEARGLQESHADGLGLSRFQADLWAELEQLGVVNEQTAAWRAAIAGLGDASEIDSQLLPAGVNARLRGYQQSGFDWLCFLRDHQLGGVLADDMGLGKTLQAIALIARAKEQGSSPYLVVAPTSVMSNWVSECDRFAPGLRAVMITETSARSPLTIAELIADADIVITSYTLFRLDFDEIDAIEWAGLLLDEAQFVKNHRSLVHQCARKLHAPFKLAITGTPLENNLMELWSLLSITAPGLFPSPTRFAEYYQKPIERERDNDRLAQLRRRIRPFMLRRTKEQVASDLPAKQEQVLALDLHPKHRKVYDTHLQRERQKVLGLIDDMARNRFEIFRSLTMLRQLALDSSLYDEKYASVPSTKLDALLELLTDIVAEGHRTLIFSQFTGYLAKTRARLDAAGISYSYLDGKTRNRPKVIEGFKSGATSVFLISLKAGGFGLNLTEADYCILLDPWWNPATEAQAIDRAHRIGQTRQVMVYRLVAKNTIEEKVMALKEAKAKLFSSVMEGVAGGTTGLSASDIRELLS